MALFNLGIDSKLRGCDLVALKVRDIQHGAQSAPRTIVTQHKTGRPVQFEITPPTRAAVQAWIVGAGLRSDDHLFPSRFIARRTSARGRTRRTCALFNCCWVTASSKAPSALGVDVHDALEISEQTEI